MTSKKCSMIKWNDRKTANSVSIKTVVNKLKREVLDLSGSKMVSLYMPVIHSPIHPCNQPLLRLYWAKGWRYKEKIPFPSSQNSVWYEKRTEKFSSVYYNVKETYNYCTYHSADRRLKFKRILFSNKAKFSWSLIC